MIICYCVPKNKSDNDQFLNEYFYEDELPEEEEQREYDCDPED